VIWQFWEARIPLSGRQKNPHPFVIKVENHPADTHTRSNSPGRVTMNIAPINALAAIPAVNRIDSAYEPTPMNRVEATARAGDDTYNASNGRQRSTRGGDIEDEEDILVEENEEESEQIRRIRSLAGRKISYFA